MDNAAVLDLSERAKRYRKAGDNAQKAVNRVCSEAARNILTEMQQRVPVDTGRLKGSLTIKVGNNTWTIGPVGVPYAPFVEFGTGTKSEFGGNAYKIRPKNAGGKLVFMVGGRKIFAKEVTHPGSRPHPFVRPAAQAYLKSLGEEVAEVGVSLIQGKTNG